MLVLSAMSPLFVLWAIRGSDLFSNYWFEAGCVLLFLFFNGILVWMIWKARKSNDTRPLVVGATEDRHHDVLVYLFALMLPFYAADLNSWRDFSATLIAFGLIVFLFWHLNLHYMNLVVAVGGYRVYAVTSCSVGERNSGMDSFIVITKRPSLRKELTIRALQVTGTLFIEEER
jgi:hypothetical protein